MEAAPAAPPAAAPPSAAPPAPPPSAEPPAAPESALPTASNAEGKRPADSAAASDESKKARTDDWRSAPSNGGAAGFANPRAEAERREETRAAVSSIKSKLSKPKATTGGWHDERKTKHGSFSAGLTREQILKSQQAHREKAEASGKPVPYYQRPK